MNKEQLTEQYQDEFILEIQKLATRLKKYHPAATDFELWTLATQIEGLKEIKCDLIGVIDAIEALEHNVITSQQRLANDIP